MFVVVFSSLFLPMSYVCLCIFVFVFAHLLCLTLYFCLCFCPYVLWLSLYFRDSICPVLCLSSYLCLCFCPCRLSLYFRLCFSPYVLRLSLCFHLFLPICLTFVLVFSSLFLPLCLMFVFATCGRPRWPLGGCGCVRSEDTLLGGGHALPAGEYFVLFSNVYFLFSPLRACTACLSVFKIYTYLHIYLYRFYIFGIIFLLSKTLKKIHTTIECTSNLSLSLNKYLLAGPFLNNSFSNIMYLCVCTNLVLF